jgi:hypothetical protein
MIPRTGGTGVPPPPASQRMSFVQLDSERGDRIRYEFSGQAGISPGLFCLGDSRVADVLRIMHFLPNAVIRGGDFGISDLVSIRSLRPSHPAPLACAGLACARPASAGFLPARPEHTSGHSKPSPTATADDEITSRRKRCRHFSPLKFPAKESPQRARVRIDVMPNI